MWLWFISRSLTKNEIFDVSYLNTVLNHMIGSLVSPGAWIMEYRNKFSVVGRLKVPLVHRKEAETCNIATINELAMSTSIFFSFFKEILTCYYTSCNSYKFIWLSSALLISILYAVILALLNDGNYINVFVGYLLL